MEGGEEEKGNSCRQPARTMLIRYLWVKAATKILAVDDNWSISSSMPFIFAAPLYELTTSAEGGDALTKLEANPNGYDVIIVDQKMPYMSGVQLVQAIRQLGISGKIVVLSGHLSPEVREAYGLMSVQIIMDKPFDIEELRSVVDRLAAYSGSTLYRHWRNRNATNL